VSLATVVAVAPGSPAAHGGVAPGDELVAIGGRPLRDVIEFRVLSDEAEVELELRRGGMELSVEITKEHGEPLGLEVDSPVFDEVRTCDNHCEFCFIHQLPPGMRRSLYLKDDDYRLSFLYGNFTTLTRFTEADLERVLVEGLSPLYVSIHATDPDVRVELLRNRRGATSLRWLRALLDHGVEVHGQIVVCPGLNDGEVLDRTLCGVLDEYPELADVAVVPLGVSAHNREPRMRPHTLAEARAVVDVVDRWQEVFLSTLGHRMVFAADEYYLLADRPFPAAGTYGDFGMHEDGIGMARAFEAELAGRTDEGIGVQPGFFNWVDGAPADGYRAPRLGAEPPAPGAGSVTSVQLGARRPAPDAPVAILTGTYGARVLAPLLDRVLTDAGRGGLVGAGVRLVPVENRWFGGNIGVAGLMVGEDVARTLAAEPAGHRYLLPDVCLSSGTFLDGTRPEDLPHRVEVVPTDGVALRRALLGPAPAETAAEPVGGLRG
jgi:putative radical SAM enzyme (TIGR03279 family)